LPKKKILQSDVMKARLVADSVIRKALADPKFREQLKSDPAKSLKKAGIPAAAIEDVSREIVLDGSSLAAGCTETCFSTCLITCMITGKGILGGEEVINPAGRGKIR
jgi:hypothetical protein